MFECSLCSALSLAVASDGELRFQKTLDAPPEGRIGGGRAIERAIECYGIALGLCGSAGR